MVSIKELSNALINSDQIVTPRYNEWMLNGNEGVYPSSVRQYILRELRKRPRNRVASFSASSGGQCERSQVFQYLGAPAEVPDPQLELIFTDGRWRHLRWQAELLSAGILADGEIPLALPNWNMKGTADGVGVVPLDHDHHSWRGKQFGFELKGVNPFQFKHIQEEHGNLSRKGVMHKHVSQIGRYFLARRDWEIFVVLYEDKGTQRTLEWVFERENIDLNETAAELDRVNRSVDTTTLPPIIPDCARGTGKTFGDCGFGGKAGVCWRTQKRSWPRVADRRIP